MGRHLPVIALTDVELWRLTASKRGIVHWEIVVARLDARGSSAPDEQAASSRGDSSSQLPRRA